MYAHGPTLPQVDNILWMFDGSNPTTENSTTIKNCVNTGQSMTLFNTPTLSGTYPTQSLTFAKASSEYSTYTAIIPSASSALTIAKAPSSTWDGIGGMGSARGLNGFIFHNNSGGSTVHYYYRDTVGFRLIGTANPTDITVPNMYIMTTNGSNSHKGFLNETRIINNTVSHTKSTPQTEVVHLGKDDTISRYTSCDIFMHILWKVELTEDECLQLYNMYNNRFGLGG
jgi:hypothetical protein